MCCGGGWGDRRGMRDREEQVNYDICKSAQQDATTTKLRKTKIIPEGKEEERRGRWRARLQA